jgi:hypothetical protein
VSVPGSIGAAMVALFFGINGIALAHYLFWRRSPTLFWLASAFVVICVGYAVLTSGAESIARSLWPETFDPVKAAEFKLRAACQTPRLLGFMLIAGPVGVLLAPVLLFKYRRAAIWVTMGFSLLAFALYASPLPEKLARAVFSESALKVPDHCGQTNR